jgi:hypothetical protein
LGVDEAGELRDNLALQLYGHVMVMEMHWDYAHFSHRDAAQPILRFIAAHRADWSTNYKAGGLPYECNRLMGQKIDAMLIRSKEPQK